MSTNIYKEASKRKLRFQTSKGVTTFVEDLWDLSLQDLDSIAVKVDKELKESSEKSFISNRTTANKEQELKLEILKDIINDKLDAKKAAEERADKRAKIQFLKEVRDQKAKEEILGKSKEEIEEMMSELEA